MVILGVAGLNFLGVAHFFFSVTSFFLTFGLVSGSGGLNWLPGAGAGISPILPSTSRKVFIFLMIVGCRQSLVLQGVHLISWVVLSLLKICIPCIDVIFTSTSTTSTRSLHLKKPCRKLHSGWSRHAMSKMKYLQVYTVSVSKLYHVIPCFIIV